MTSSLNPYTVVGNRRRRRSLSSLGYISDADYERLRQLRGQRNAAAHLTGGQAPDPGDIEYALDIVARMLDGRYTPGD
jgi:hypothetical protein